MNDFKEDLKESAARASSDEKIEDAFADTILQSFPLIKDKSPEELESLNKAVVRKLDWRYLPIVTLMLFMSYLDRSNVSNARLAGMQKDIGNMSDTLWSAGISLYYVGYIITQIPANVITAKGQPRWLLPGCMMAWSIVTLCTAAVKTTWAFLLCRFLVGFAEGPFFPAVGLMTATWYTKEESPFRMSIWHTSNILSSIFTPFLAAGVLPYMYVAGLQSWQWFFILEGTVSVLVAIAGMFLLPNWPENTDTYYFSKEESEMARYRQAVSTGGISNDDEGGYWEGFSLCLRDPFTYIFTFLHFVLIIAQSFKDFFPSITETLGFSELVTYLVQAPPYVISYIFTLVVSWSSGRMQEFSFHIIGAISTTLIGAIVMISTLDIGARYFALVLLCCGPFLGLVLHLSWEASVVPRPRTKRAALIAIANAVSSVTHWFSPYFFLRSQEPRYATGGGLIIAGCGGTIIGVLIARWWCRRKNKALDRAMEANGVVNNWRFVY